MEQIAPGSLSCARPPGMRLSVHLIKGTNPTEASIDWTGSSKCQRGCHLGLVILLVALGGRTYSVSSGAPAPASQVGLKRIASPQSFYPHKGAIFPLHTAANTRKAGLRARAEVGRLSLQEPNSKYFRLMVHTASAPTDPTPPWKQLQTVLKQTDGPVFL